MISSGEPILGELELHLYPNSTTGWCLTWKEPIADQQGNIVGLSGISRDLNSGVELHDDWQRVAAALNHIRENLDRQLHVDELADIAELSSYQLDSRVRSLFGVSTSQYIGRMRIELACRKLLRSDEPITDLAKTCGYSDASSFTRQFRKMVGMTPSSFRESANHADDRSNGPQKLA